MSDLTGVKPGMFLVVEDAKRRWFERVERLTPTRVIVASGAAYITKTGVEWGQSQNPSRGTRRTRIATPKDIEQAKAVSRLRGMIRELDTRALDFSRPGRVWQTAAGAAAIARAADLIQEGLTVLQNADQAAKAAQVTPE